MDSEQINNFPHGAPGSKGYDKMVNYLASPAVLAYIVLSIVSLLIGLIIWLSNLGISGKDTLQNALNFALSCLLVTASIKIHLSARNYFELKTPISPSVFNLARGLFIAYLVISSLGCLLSSLSFILSLDHPGFYTLYSLITGLIIALFGVVYYLCLLKGVESVKNLLCGTGMSEDLSLAPFVLKLINAGFTILYPIFNLVILFSSDNDVYISNELNFWLGITSYIITFGVYISASIILYKIRKIHSEIIILSLENDQTAIISSITDDNSTSE